MFIFQFEKGFRGGKKVEKTPKSVNLFLYIPLNKKKVFYGSIVLLRERRFLKNVRIFTAQKRHLFLLTFSKNIKKYILFYSRIINFKIFD